MNSEAYSEPSQTSKMESKPSILDFWQGFEYAYGTFCSMGNLDIEVLYTLYITYIYKHLDILNFKQQIEQ